MKLNNSLKILFLFSLASCFLLTACGQNEHDHPELVTGKQLFEFHCAACHQHSGQGKLLKGIPKNKNTHLSFSQVVQKITTADHESRKMPVFDSMSIEEASKIAAYLKSL